MKFVKKNLLVLIIISIVIFSVVVGICLQNKDENKDNNEKYTKLICSNEYEDGESVKIEFTYDFFGKKLKRYTMDHVEIDLNEENQWDCERFNLLSGITCNFDKTNSPYKYTIEFDIAKFDDESRKMIEEIKYDSLFSLSLIEAKKHLIESEDYSGMICKVLDENNKVVKEETNTSSENKPKENDKTNTANMPYLGKYIGTGNEYASYSYIELKENNLAVLNINFCGGWSVYNAKYRVNNNKLYINSFSIYDGIELDLPSEMSFEINENKLITIVGFLDNGNFDCGVETTFVKY